MCGPKSGAGTARIGPLRRQHTSTSGRKALRRIKCRRRSSTHASFARRRMGAFVVLFRAVLQPVEVGGAVLVFHGSVALPWFWDLLPDVLQYADARCVWSRQRNPLNRSDSFTLFIARRASCVGDFASAAYSQRAGRAQLRTSLVDREIFWTVIAGRRFFVLILRAVKRRRSTCGTSS